MRVALYQGTARFGQDGTTRTLEQMLAAMERAGINYRVFTPDPPDHSDADLDRFVRLPGIRLPFYRDYALALPGRRRFFQALDQFAPDLVQIGVPDVAGFLLLKWARKRGVPAIGAYHTHFPAYLRHYGFGPLLALGWHLARRFYGACAATLVPSAVIARELAAHGIPRLHPWPRGVDCLRFSPGHRSEELRRRCGAGGNDILFAYVGRLAAEKNVELLARAWPILKARVPGARLLWVGAGPLRSRLERWTPEATFTGRLGGQALTSAFASGDALVFPSQTDTFGNVVLEAMASGLPVIGLQATAATACVRDRDNGRLVQPATPDALADAMAELAQDQPARAAMARAALRFARTQSWQSVFDRQFSVYRDVLARHSGRPARAATSAGSPARTAA